MGNPSSYLKIWNKRVCQGLLYSKGGKTATKERAFEILKKRQNSAALLISKSQREYPEQEENIKKSL